MKLSFGSTWLCILVHHAFIASKGVKNEWFKIKKESGILHVQSNIGENKHVISQTLLSHGQQGWKVQLHL